LIETHGGDKNTPLHEALEYFKPRNGGDIAVLAYLIHQKNADVNSKNEKGYTSFGLI
jgi:hypothetical protein